MSETKVVNVRKIKGTRPDYDIYIGRAVRYTDFTKNSIWYNPFKAPRDGTRAEVIAKYEVYIRAKIAENPGKYDLESLRGKRLGCWCFPLSCHGDILVKLLKEKEVAG